MSFHTRTGNFPIGFRRIGSPWNQDLDSLLDWTKDNGFEVLDLTRKTEGEVERVIAAGLRIGSVDLPDWDGMISSDPKRRQEAVSRNAAHVRACGKIGPVNHFTIMIPADKAADRSENFAFMIESYRQLAPIFEEAQAKLVIEGWPGPGVLCCTPENLRVFFRECPSASFGINYDPSHLIRMGIDPIRFLQEFGDRIFHIHGKDTEMMFDQLYDFGTELPPTFEKPLPWGHMHWRYTIPGHGTMRWQHAFTLLRDQGYEGCVSVELEDMHFNGSEESEKEGLLRSAHFLAGC